MNMSDFLNWVEHYSLELHQHYIHPIFIIESGEIIETNLLEFKIDYMACWYGHLFFSEVFKKRVYMNTIIAHPNSNIVLSSDHYLYSIYLDHSKETHLFYILTYDSTGIVLHSYGGINKFILNQCLINDINLFLIQIINHSSMIALNNLYGINVPYQAYQFNLISIEQFVDWCPSLIELYDIYDRVQSSLLNINNVVKVKSLKLKYQHLIDQKLKTEKDSCGYSYKRSKIAMGDQDELFPFNHTLSKSITDLNKNAVIARSSNIASRSFVAFFRGGEVIYGYFYANGSNSRVITLTRDNRITQTTPKNGQLMIHFRDQNTLLPLSLMTPNEFQLGLEWLNDTSREIIQFELRALMDLSEEIDNVIMELQSLSLDELRRVREYMLRLH